MPRDPGLETLVQEMLADTPGITRKPMFGGMAFLLHGHLLFGVRQGSLLIRLGKGNDVWALAHPGITPMSFTTRTMPGWVRAAPSAFSDDALRNRLFHAALDFARTLPPKR